MSRPLIAAFQGHSPRIPTSAFIAPTATLVGDVVLGEESSVWYGTVIRGDVGPIRIGRRTNIQDCCILHLTRAGDPIHVWNALTVGHLVILYRATIPHRGLAVMA